MIEVSANIPGAGSNAHAIDATHNGAHNSAKATTSEKIADDDAAVAIIRNPPQTQTEGIQQDGSTNNLSIAGIIKENLLRLKELAKELEAQLGQANKSIQDVEVSGVLEYLKKEIEAIRAFEGFLLGVHDKIDEFTKFVEFRLEQILDVEQHMAETNGALELGAFTVARMKKEALQSLRCQANTDPDRDLHFLENVKEEDTTKCTEQSIAKQDSEQA